MDVDKISDRLQLLFPKCWQNKIRDFFHDSLLSGHLSIKKIINTIRKIFYWSDYMPHTRKWIERCKVCHKREPPS